MSRASASPIPHEVTDIRPRSAVEREKAKSPVKKAEDVMYVVTHTVTCLTCDILFPIIGAKISQLREAKKAHVEQHSMLEHFKGWFEAEVIGDFGAIVPTIALQRFAPGFMESLNKGMSHIIGPVYRWGAERSTAKWGVEHSIGKDSPEYRAHADKIYNDEASHFAQMAVWTVTSSAGNVLWQKYKIGGTATAGEIVADKVKAGLTASAIVMGSRAMWPEASQARDRFMGKHVIVPATKILGKPFGIDAAAVDEASRQKQDGVPGRVVTQPEPPQKIAASERARV